jgi:hypothetical protein
VAATGSGPVAEGRATLDRQADKTRAKARSGTGWYEGLARTGLVAKGVSYGLVGALAIGVAIDAGGKATSRQGALSSLADHSWGKLILILLAAGFAAYAAWRFVQAFAEPEDPSDGEAKGEAKQWGKRAGYVGRGLVYAGLAWSTVALLLGGGEGESQTEKAHHTTRTVLSWPAGRYLVGIAGLCLIGAGLWNAYRGLAKKFADRWRGGMSATERTWGEPAGLVGHLARGVVFTLIGFFVTKAAVDYKPNDAIGLDGALQKLAHATYGPWLLGVTAAGLIAYGIFCLVDARYRDVSAGG